MGRYDWEEKLLERERRVRSSERGDPFGRSTSTIFAFLTLALAGVLICYFAWPGPPISSRGTNATRPSRVSRSQVGSSQVRTGETAAPLEAANRAARGKIEIAGDRPVPRKERFAHCGEVRVTCVVDGDTLWLEGEKIRVADIDTPEVSEPRCPSEKALGNRATDRFISLLNEGPFEVVRMGDRDQDQYGRKLRVLVRNGRSLGDQLVTEGLARAWTDHREPWC